MLIVHINDLQVKSIQPQVLNNVQPNLSSKNVAHEPYFLIKNDNITEAVNDPLEKVSQLWIDTCIRIVINIL